MSYGFDDNKGKVPIEPILNQLQINYQNNVNTIYNAITAQGTTPAGKTPAQIADGISTMATAKYNSGYSQGYMDARNVNWEQSLSFNISGANTNPYFECPLINVTHAYVYNSSEDDITVIYKNSNGSVIGSEIVPEGRQSYYLSIPTNAVVLGLSIERFDSLMFGRIELVCYARIVRS